jgi:hypothetical protein
LLPSPGNEALSYEHKDMADWHTEQIDTAGHSDDVPMGDTLGPKGISLTPAQREAELMKANPWGPQGINTNPAAGLRAVPRSGAPTMGHEADEATETIDSFAGRKTQ